MMGLPSCRKVLAVTSDPSIRLNIEHRDYFGDDLMKRDCALLNLKRRVFPLKEGDVVLCEFSLIMPYLAHSVLDNDPFSRAVGCARIACAGSAGGSLASTRHSARWCLKRWRNRLS